jgi:transposase-like protein
MYSKCLNVVQQFDIAPSTVIIDFEKAEENSCRASFPQSNVHGCFFHFAQAIWRNIQKIVVDGIRWSDRYNDDDDFALDIR